MGAVVADRVDRPPSLFDMVEVAERVQSPARHTELERRLLDEREASVRRADAGGEAREHGGVGGEPTLDEMIVGAWEGLTAQAVVQCPLCEGTLRPLYGDGNGGSPVVAGRCDRCETTLS